MAEAAAELALARRELDLENDRSCQILRVHVGQMRWLDQKVDLLDRQKRFARAQPLLTMCHSTHRLLSWRSSREELGLYGVLRVCPRTSSGITEFSQHEAN
jgi:hypothetical protein